MKLLSTYLSKQQIGFGKTRRGKMAKIPYTDKIANKDLRGFIRKKRLCGCGDMTLNASGKCDTCELLQEVEGQYGNR